MIYSGPYRAVIGSSRRAESVRKQSTEQQRQFRPKGVLAPDRELSAWIGGCDLGCDPDTVRRNGTADERRWIREPPNLNVRFMGGRSEEHTSELQSHSFIS